MDHSLIRSRPSSAPGENSTPRWRIFALIIPLIVATVGVLPTVAAWEIDATGVVYYVVDGDTVDVDNLGRVRLADVNAPEVGQPGYQAARDFVNATVRDKDVFLDIDDVSEKDVYDRWVCVVYVRHNATHLLNLNEALLEEHLAVLDDFNNEFNPSTWTLYVIDPAAASPSPVPQGVLDVPWFWVALFGAVILGTSGIAYTILGRRSRPRKPRA